MREHSLPLSAQCLSLLETCPFSTNGWGKNKARLDRLSGITDWTIHDLRRTFATIHAKIGTPPHIIEALLNHASGQISGVAAIYNRYQYADEKRSAMQRYDEYLASIFALSSPQHNSPNTDGNIDATGPTPDETPQGIDRR